PDKTQIANGGNQPQSDRFSGRQQERALIIVILFPRQKLFDRYVSEVPGRKDVRDGGCGLSGKAAAFCEVSFKKGSMPPSEPAKGVQSFHNPSALCPAAACTGSKRDDGHFTLAKRSHPELARMLEWGRHPACPTGRSRPGIDNI